MLRSATPSGGSSGALSKASKKYWHTSWNATFQRLHFGPVPLQPCLKHPAFLAGTASVGSGCGKDVGEEDAGAQVRAAGLKDSSAKRG